MARTPEIGNVQLYPNRPLRKADKNGYVLKFFCPILGRRIRKATGTRDGREARRIVRECRQRLLDGKYLESHGAITERQELSARAAKRPRTPADNSQGLSWEECYDRYFAFRKNRLREKSLVHLASRIGLAKRILDTYRTADGESPSAAINDLITMDSMEYLQDRLLTGDECRYDRRSPMTVNTTLGAVMAFARYCHRHEWIEKVPYVAKVEVSDPMKGRPITSDEFDKMVNAVPEVVGVHASSSWQRVLKIIWESAFRVGDVMNFSWDDDQCIHPSWPGRADHLPTIVIPSSQKNKKTQEIPMFPELQKLLLETPKSQQRGWVVNPLPIEHVDADDDRKFKPTTHQLIELVEHYSNSAIARACRVTEAAVRKWIDSSGISPNSSPRRSGEIEHSVIAKWQTSKVDSPTRTISSRLTKDYVGRVISEIGKKAKVVVQAADEETGRRIKYASAHDLRRGCAFRLINAGVSAETLKIIMRHDDFGTTQRFYGANRAVQSAAAELVQKLRDSKPD